MRIRYEIEFDSGSMRLSSPNHSAVINMGLNAVIAGDLEKIIFDAIYAEVLNQMGSDRREHDFKMIEERSFSIIDSMLPRDIGYPMRYIVMKIVHSTADFAMVNLVRYSEGFFQSMVSRLRAGTTIIVDSEMVRSGIYAKPVLNKNKIACYLNDDETAEIAEQRGITRSAAGIMKGLLKNRNSVIVIGNSPTALDQAITMIEENGWYDVPVVGVPVGFVNAKSVKDRLMSSSIEHFTVYGHRGGSSVAASIVNGFGRFL
ncbi:precorrin-8X methylmutase [Thermoplasma sp.]|uniref:precorrin-8X methylmutase n=1 Tax=Thermoplasma sp. TaxID=1973142 RepID=UPI002619F543|nr:precorrin-8X methylmutase [Thermoplasma sp.]